MNDQWQVIESKNLSAEAIMAKDAFLLDQLNEKSFPILHLYEWESPCLTYGYFIDLTLQLNMENVEHLGIQKARRPTGGGIIFHIFDLAFSVLIPAHHPRFSMNTFENYALINEKVVEAVSHFTKPFWEPYLLSEEPLCLEKDCQSFCMAKQTRFDLIAKGKKIGGAAQRRTKAGLLHQSSLFLLFPPKDLLSQLLKNQEILKNMRQNSGSLLSEEATVKDLTEVRCDLQKLLRNFILSI